MKILIFLLEVLMVSLALAQELYTYKLPNGAHLIVKRRDDTQAVALQVWFKVGSIYENYQEKGMAHFLEHMLFNGSEKYPYGEIDKRVESMGGNINAGTSKDYTFYHIEIAKPYWKEALELLYELTQKPLLLESMVEKEKPIVIEELKRGKDNPTTLLWEEFEKLSYKVSPYRFPIIGYEETIKSFTRESLLKFYRNFYQPKNMYIVIVGDVNPQDVKEEVLRTFGKEEGRTVERPQIPKEPEQIGPRFKEIKDSRLEKAYWIIGWRSPAVGSKEYYALVVLDQVLGGGRTSLLYRELKEKGLVYSVFTGDLGRAEDNMYVISATFDPGRYHQVKERLKEVLDELYKSLSDEEVKKAKERVINSDIFSKEKADNDAYYIGYSATVIGTLDYYKYFENNIKSVRRQDVLKVLKKYLNDNYNEVLMVPER
ncbi:M16 family metallopeptidase [Hydrogenobacter thermophilus]|uniref:Processing protease n=1 Tax=Hydrogenobacter thermophilus (strain DSM 6534 / IAM 12695 / TK-6) TaxID=608538 RepID=D3DJR4_HYDTT|nr:pitrilysin family protein [Hydrogenobacter thermophilus]BAI70066.1 processing protease [Hydrogenobacter thermophilus TK-6]